MISLTIVHWSWAPLHIFWPFFTHSLTQIHQEYLISSTSDRLTRFVLFCYHEYSYLFLFLLFASQYALFFNHWTRCSQVKSQVNSRSYKRLKIVNFTIVNHSAPNAFMVAKEGWPGLKVKTKSPHGKQFWNRASEWDAIIGVVNKVILQEEYSCTSFGWGILCFQRWKYHLKRAKTHFNADVRFGYFLNSRASLVRIHDQTHTRFAALGIKKSVIYCIFSIHQ